MIGQEVGLGVRTPRPAVLVEHPQRAECRGSGWCDPPGQALARLAESSDAGGLLCETERRPRRVAPFEPEVRPHEGRHVDHVGDRATGTGEGVDVVPVAGGGRARCAGGHGLRGWGGDELEHGARHTEGPGDEVRHHRCVWRDGLARPVAVGEDRAKESKPPVRVAVGSSRCGEQRLAGRGVSAGERVPQQGAVVVAVPFGCRGRVPRDVAGVVLEPALWVARSRIVIAADSAPAQVLSGTVTPSGAWVCTGESRLAAPLSTR